MIDKNKMEIENINVLKDNYYVNRLDERDNYSKFKAEVTVLYDDKLYTVMYEESYDNENGGNTAEVIDDKDIDEELNDALTDYVEENNGELKE